MAARRQADDRLLQGAVARHGRSITGKAWKRPGRICRTDFKEKLLRGSGAEEIEFTFWRAGKMSKTQKPFEGVIPNLERLYVESESEFTKNRLKGFMNPQPCDACGGRRLKPEILAPSRLGSGSPPHGRRLGTASPRDRKLDPKPNPLRRAFPSWKFAGCPSSRRTIFSPSLKLTEFQQKIAAEVIKEIRARLGFLKNVGLGYLTLDRESGTLSGGEAQRIRLATQIGAGLVGVLYILDEPSIGLHQRDNERLLQSLEGLRDLGNSVLVVEHDEETIRRADYVLDLGPGAGVRGGELVAAGAVAEIEATPRSLTGQYLKGELKIAIPKTRFKPSPDRGWLEVLGARGEQSAKHQRPHSPGRVDGGDGRERFGQEHAGG